MNSLSAIMYKSKHATADHPVLAIDGVPVQLWIRSQIVDHGIDGLVPAQGWLLDDEHSKIAWKLLEAAEGSSTVVPLLICPDDMDLNCTVIVVEQVTNAGYVAWKRFGLAADYINGVISSVKWSENEQSATFNRYQFDDAISEFKRLTTNVWGTTIS